MNWFLIIVNLLGGLAIFLFGMDLMSEGINKSTGKGIRNLLRSFTKNRFSSMATGIVSTTILQSSSAVSVMTIGFVKARVMTFPQTIGILLGAGIGTTITAQIIAFKISDYALLIVALGFFTSIASSRTALKLVGSAILGFGLLFFGLQLMSNAMYPLRDYQPFIETLARLQNPLLGILAGFLFTALIQSSSAFIGILIVLGTQGIITLESSVAMLLGSNLGTTATSIIAGLNAGYESKRVATAFFIIKLIGVLLIVWWIPVYSHYIETFTVASTGENNDNLLPRQIANAHTAFNVLVTIILMPFTKTLAHFVNQIIPEKEPKKEVPVHLEYIDNKMIENPSIALTLAKNETLHYGDYIAKMLAAIEKAFLNKDQHSLMDVKELKSKGEYLHKHITEYITQVSKQNLSEELSLESFHLLYIMSELYDISDELTDTLSAKALDWVNESSDFSDKGKTELRSFFEDTRKQFNQVIEVINDLDKSKALKLKQKHKKIRRVAEELKQKHFERLTQNIPETIESSKAHMDLMGSLRAIHSHLANIVRFIVRDLNEKQ